MAAIAGVRFRRCLIIALPFLASLIFLPPFWPHGSDEMAIATRMIIFLVMAFSVLILAKLFLRTTLLRALLTVGVTGLYAFTLVVIALRVAGA